MKNTLSPQERAELFATWYRWDGHWLYSSRAEALRTWQQRGITGRQDCTPEAASMLADWAKQ